jgi:hypothetical protein
MSLRGIRARINPNIVVAVVLALSVLGSIGPHLLILGYRAAGVTPPSTLVFFCPLHRLADESASKQLVIKAKPLS